jgi:transposase
MAYYCSYTPVALTMFKPKVPPLQPELWVPACKLQRGPTAPFWDRFQEFLSSLKFDDRVRALCAKYYTVSGPGHPGVDPAVYFKMLLIGFFENITSERALALRCADSLSIREFLGYDVTERTPDHSTLSVIRKRLPETVYNEVFGLVLPRLEELGLIRGRNLGMDTSVIDANASKRELRNRLSGEQYRAYVKNLAREAGVDTDDPAAVSRFDKNRPGRKTSNDEWQNPHDPDAKIGPTKHGGSRMIYKPEHMVDMDSGAILDARVLSGDQADSTDLEDRVIEAEQRAAAVLMPDDMDLPIESLTNDKGYGSTKNTTVLSEMIPHVNIPERTKDRNLDRLTEEEREAILRSRAFVQSAEGKALLKKRGMHVERSFAHILDCGGMRRTTLRGRENIQKRYSIAALGYNLSLAMRHIYRIGTPKQFAAASKKALIFVINAVKIVDATLGLIIRYSGHMVETIQRVAEYAFGRFQLFALAGKEFSSTGC